MGGNWLLGLTYWQGTFDYPTLFIWLTKLNVSVFLTLSSFNLYSSPRKSLCVTFDNCCLLGFYIVRHGNKTPTFIGVSGVSLTSDRDTTSYIICYTPPIFLRTQYSLSKSTDIVWLIFPSVRILCTNFLKVIILQLSCIKSEIYFRVAILFIKRSYWVDSGPRVSHSV